MEYAAENAVYNRRDCSAELAKDATLELLKKPNKSAENVFWEHQKPKPKSVSLLIEGIRMRTCCQ